MSQIDPPSVLVDTSVDAAEAIRPTAETLRNMVLSLIVCRGDYGATDDEIQAALSLTGNTQRPRRWELCRMNTIKDSGIRRKTSSGRNAIVWVFGAARRRARKTLARRDDEQMVFGF